MPHPSTAPARKPRTSAALRATRETTDDSTPKAVLSLEAADSILREMGQLEALQASLKADCDQAVSAATRRYTDQLFCDVDGKRVPIADRLAELEDSLHTFARKQRGRIFEDGAKSRVLNFGTIGFRESPDRLIPAKDDEKAGNKQLLEGMAGWLLEKLERFTWRGAELFKAGVMRFVRIKPEWDKRALLAAIQRKQMSAAELKKAGFLFQPGEDEFFAKPSDQACTSQPGEPRE